MWPPSRQEDITKQRTVGLAQHPEASPALARSTGAASTMPEAYLQTHSLVQADFSQTSAVPLATQPITLLTATFTHPPPWPSRDHSGKRGQKEQSHQHILCFQFWICSQVWVSSNDLSIVCGLLTSQKQGAHPRHHGQVPGGHCCSQHFGPKDVAWTAHLSCLGPGSIDKRKTETV